MDQPTQSAPPQPTTPPQTPIQSGQTPIPPVNSPPPSQPKKSFLKNPFFYLVLVMLLIFAGGYYYVYSTLENKVEQLTKEVKPTGALPNPSPQPTPSLKTYTDQYGILSLQYPSNLKLNEDKNTSDLALYIDVTPIDKLVGTMRYDKDTAIKDVPELAGGKFGEIIDWPLESSQQVIDLTKTYGKSFIVFGRFDVCDVTFDRFLIFYRDNKRVLISLSGNSKKIVESMPAYFAIDAANCGKDQKVWKRNVQDSFYKTLKEGKGGSAAQDWFDEFDTIIKTIEIK